MSAAAYGALAGLQVAAGYFAADNIRNTAKLNQEIADMNAEFAELDAYDAEIDGYSEVARYQTVVDATLGEQQAQLAAADVDLSFGTAASIQQETRFIADMNKREILNNAEERALGYEREGKEFRFKGFLGVSEGEQRASAARFAGISSGAQTGISGYRRSR